MRLSTTGRLVPTGTGEAHLGGGPYAVQVGLVENSGDILRHRRRGEGSDGFRDPHGANPPRMQRLPQGASWSARSPASEWRAGVWRVLTRVIACSTSSTKGCPSLAALGFPTGRCRAQMKPAAGSAIIPGLRPNWAGPWRLPLHMGAMLGS
jgi:hypothetical protein